MPRESVSAIWPILHYEDTNRALEFLIAAFGFDAGAVVHDDEGQVLHAEMHLPQGGSLVFGSTQRGEGVHSDLPTGCSACYVVTDDIDSSYARALHAGADIVNPPHGTTFGTGIPTRAFTARDPEGNLWTFGSYTGANLA